LEFTNAPKFRTARHGSFHRSLLHNEPNRFQQTIEGEIRRRSLFSIAPAVASAHEDRF
jgi:hypothetical protein